MPSISLVLLLVMEDASQGRYSTFEVWTLADTKKAGEPDVTNSFAAPERIVPVASKFQATGAKFDYIFPGYSLTVLRLR